MHDDWLCTQSPSAAILAEQLAFPRLLEGARKGIHTAPSRSLQKQVDILVLNVFAILVFCSHCLSPGTR
jgi:hypothetical protein